MTDSNTENEVPSEETPLPNRYRLVYQTQRHDGDHLAFTIPVAVAEATERDHDELPPLYDAIDPDELNGIIDSLRENEHSAMRFSYAGHLVEVHGSGKVTLWNRTEK